MKYRVMQSLPSEEYLVFLEIGNGLFLLINGFSSEDHANAFAENLENANNLD